MALLLVGFVRAMIDGADAAASDREADPGTGATLMVDAIATILTGTGASVMIEGSDDEEWRKRMTAKLRQIPSMVLIDNLRRQARQLRRSRPRLRRLSGRTGSSASPR